MFPMNGQGACETGSCRSRGFQAAGCRGISDLDIRMVSDPWVCAVAPPSQWLLGSCIPGYAGS